MAKHDRVTVHLKNAGGSITVRARRSGGSVRVQTDSDGVVHVDEMAGRKEPYRVRGIEVATSELAMLITDTATKSTDVRGLADELEIERVSLL